VKLVLPFLETMATQVCNLSCAGCTNYSDLTHSGYVRWVDMKQQLESWLAVIDIPDFGIMGGEPLVNPEIRQWLHGVRELMPASQIRFTTNGLLLDKYFDVVDLAHDIGNIVFKITVHQDTAELENTIDRIFKRYAWEPVTEYGIRRWVGANGVRFQVNRPEVFLKTYQGTYADMRPWANNPADSFDSCIQQTCPLLHQGRIYKCSTQGLLKETLEKFNNPNLDSWQPYLVDGIGPDSDGTVIKSFIDNFAKPHSMCSMCPSSNDAEAKLVHKINVKRK